MKMIKFAIILLLFSNTITYAQAPDRFFRIRTITAGITLKDVKDTASFTNAIIFLKKAEKQYKNQGYEVQTLRIATQNFYNYAKAERLHEMIPYLAKLDKIAQRNNISVSIGQIIEGNNNSAGMAEWAVKLLQATTNISFSIPISSHKSGIHLQSIKASAAIIVAISKYTAGGEGNFRFTAAANCPPGIPFFPAAYHEGMKSFAIGLESPNLLKSIIDRTDKIHVKAELKSSLEQAFLPVQRLAEMISKTHNWKYDGIDLSPAPGLDASIGAVIEAYTKQPFGSAFTLSACAMLTDVLKSLNIKKCGYSGLMLPVIEDKVLAQRAGEGRYTVQELLLYSSVSGTGLDVVPLPGSTSAEAIEAILTDVAALSLKYTAKALSVRLFLIPGKSAGEIAEFANPYLTTSTVMKLD